MNFITMSYNTHSIALYGSKWCLFEKNLIFLSSIAPWGNGLQTQKLLSSGDLLLLRWAIELTGGGDSSHQLVRVTEVGRIGGGVKSVSTTGAIALCSAKAEAWEGLH